MVLRVVFDTKHSIMNVGILKDAGYGEFLAF